MATVFSKYDHTHKCFANGTVDWDTDTIKLALVTSGYTFSAAHTQFASVTAYDLTTADGYTAGGATVTTSLDNAKLDAVDVSWTALDKTFRGAVLYKVGTANGVVDPLIGYILFDNTGGGADIVWPGIDFIVIWDATGVFTL